MRVHILGICGTFMGGIAALAKAAGHQVSGSDENVYPLTRNTDNPVIVLSREGEFIRTFGAGTFTDRTHAIVVGPDGSLYCADDGAHTITRWTPEGELLLTIGTPGQSAPRFSGEPFNRPTDAAIPANSGDLYISGGDGHAPPEHPTVGAILDDLEGGQGEENQKNEYDQQEDPEGQTQCVGQRLIGRVHGFAHRRR